MAGWIFPVRTTKARLSHSKFPGKVEMMKTRILLVDYHAIVRLGLMTLINDQPDMQVVGEAGTAAEAVNAVEKLKPEVKLMDTPLPGENGIEATRQVTARFPKSKGV